MMRVSLMVILLATCLSGAGFGQGQGTTVFVKSEDREGQGITRPLGSQCYVIVPRHVVGKNQVVEGGNGVAMTWIPDPNPIQIIGRNANRTRASVVSRSLGDDIAILEVERAGGGVCTGWPDARRSRSALTSRRSTSKVEVTYNDGQGRQRWFPVTISGDDGRRFIELRGADIARRGFSGGIVSVNGIVVGMVTHVDPSSGTASAYRFDDIDRLVGGFFDRPLPPSRAAIVSSILVPGLGQFASNRRAAGVALLGMSLVGTVVAFGLPKDVVKTDTYLDFTGTPREYSRIERGYPYRKASPLVWIAGGALSAVESAVFARQLRRSDSRLWTIASGGTADFVSLTGGDLSAGTVEVVLVQLRS